MKVSATEFDHIHHSAQTAYSAVEFKNYIFHNLTVYNTICIGEEELNAGYQSGGSFLHGDYNAPSNRLSLYKDGSHPLLVLLDDLCESDFENSEYIAEKSKEAQELCSAIKNAAALFDAYVLATENAGNAEQYRVELELSTNTEDYDMDEFLDGFCLAEDLKMNEK